MTPIAKKAWLVGGAAAVLGGAVLTATALSDRAAGDRRETLSQPVTPALVARGAYVARLADCAACHSVPDRPDYSGGLAMALPIGKVMTSNITPDKTYGIGGWSFGDFDRAVRYGVNRRDQSLYPAMPYVAYARMSRADTEALYAYFSAGVAPAATPAPRNEILFPLSMRFPLTLWRWLFAKAPEAIAPPSAADPAVARAPTSSKGPAIVAIATPRGGRPAGQGALGRRRTRLPRRRQHRWLVRAEPAGRRARRPWRLDVTGHRRLPASRRQRSRRRLRGDGAGHRAWDSPPDAGRRRGDRSLPEIPAQAPWSRLRLRCGRGAPLEGR
ncbi:hypothetical protein [Caulobacter sp. UC70_42]|uniref:hypothetical protein n=1 Tax=Caulobacter sp. UC70_42 TaxID=3374551 RepID=UPI003756C4F8